MAHHFWTPHYPGTSGWYWIKFAGEDRVCPAHVRTGIRSSTMGKTTCFIVCAGQIMYPGDIDYFWTERIAKPTFDGEEMKD